MSEDTTKMPEPSIPNIYAIIPAAVRYDPELRPNAKLIYGEISALTSAYGYCWATNKYFADLYGFNKQTVSSLISSLADRGYITVEVCRAKKGMGAVEERKIWLNSTFRNAIDPIHQKMDTPITQKIDRYPSNNGYPIHQKAKENNTSINNTPYSPPEGDARFDAFWSAYPRKVDKQKAIKSFKWLKVDDELLRVILAALEKQKRSPQWTKDGGTYIPHPTTWLNNRRWEAEDAQSAAGASSSKVIESQVIPEW